MKVFADYERKYQNIRFRRSDGILEATFHTDGGSLVWSEVAHRELPFAFADIAADEENRVVILTGAGEVFCTQLARDGWGDIKSPTGRDKIFREGRRLIRNLLDIEVPIISAVNGPAHHHAELLAVGDIVLASDSASFRDPHFSIGRVPGDGVHVIWPLLMGINRARYFQLTGRIMPAREALELGIIAEVLAPGQLLPRAWELAHQLARASSIQLRYTRIALNLQLQAALEPALGYGLSLENIAALDDSSRGRMAPTDPDIPVVSPATDKT